MAGELIVVAGVEPEVRERISDALHAEGYKVLNVSSEEAAVASLGQMKLAAPVRRARVAAKA